MCRTYAREVVMKRPGKHASGAKPVMPSCLHSFSQAAINHFILDIIRSSLSYLNMPSSRSPQLKQPTPEKRLPESTKKRGPDHAYGTDQSSLIHTQVILYGSWRVDFVIQVSLIRDVFCPLFTDFPSTQIPVKLFDLPNGFSNDQMLKINISNSNDG